MTIVYVPGDSAARSIGADEVAALIRFPCLYDGEVGKAAAFKDIVLTVEALHFLAVSHLGADAGLGVKAGDASAARAHPLCQRPLRRELYFQFACQILPFKLLVLPHIGGDHFLDLARAQQLAEAFAVDPGVVGGHREALYARRHQRVDQRKPVPRLWAGGSHLQADSPGCTTERTRPLMAMMSLRLKS